MASRPATMAQPCSDSPSDEGNGLSRKRQYERYLRSAEWRQLRELAIERAGGRCQLCNVAAPTFNVHHRTYERFGRERVEDLTVLCVPCHRKHHAPAVERKGRGERRRQIDAEILEIVEASGLIAWRDVQRQIKAPRAQAWARAQRLLRAGKLAWVRGRLCLYAKRDVYGQ